MRISLRGLGRRRTVISVVGSVAAHLLVLGALVWVKPPSMVVDVKRGEPLFVELPEVDEQAQRGLPASATAAPPKAAPASRLVPPAAKSAPTQSPAPTTPAPPVVAKAAPEPEQVTPLPGPPSPPVAPAPAPPPPVAEAPAPAQPSQEAPSEAAGPKVAVAPPSPRERVPDIRSALRGGGAGGLGEERHGIYGDPVPLDTKDQRYVDYFARIRPMIENKWVYPCPEGNPVARDCARRESQFLAEIGIAKNGDLSYLVLKTSSGSRNMDEFALTAVKLAAPFPPLPASVGKDGVAILISFRYVLIENSLTNLLR